MNKTKQKSYNYILLNKICKTVSTYLYCKIFIKKQIIFIQNSLLPFKQLYANVVLYKIANKSIFKILILVIFIFQFYNKTNKIDIKLNNKIILKSYAHDLPKTF